MFTQETLKLLSGPRIFKSGVKLYLEGKIKILQVEPDRVVATMDGQPEINFSVIKTENRYQFGCDCRIIKSKICRHLVALGLEIIERRYFDFPMEEDPILFPIRLISRKPFLSGDMDKELEKLSKKDLIRLIKKEADINHIFGEFVYSATMNEMAEDTLIDIDYISEIIRKKMEAFDIKRAFVKFHQNMQGRKRDERYIVLEDTLFDYLGEIIGKEIGNTVLELIGLGRIPDAIKVAVAFWEVLYQDFWETIPFEEKKIEPDFWKFFLVDYFMIHTLHLIAQYIKEKKSIAPDVLKKAIDIFFDRVNDFDEYLVFIHPWLTFFEEFSEYQEAGEYFYQKFINCDKPFYSFPRYFQTYILRISGKLEDELIKNILENSLTVDRKMEILEKFKEEREVFYFVADIFVLNANSKKDVKLLKNIYENAIYEENPDFYKHLLMQLYILTKDPAYNNELYQLYSDTETEGSDSLESYALYPFSESLEEEDMLDDKIIKESLLYNPDILAEGYLSAMENEGEYLEILKVVRENPSIGPIREYILSIKDRYPGKLFEILTSYIRKSLDVQDEKDAKRIVDILAALAETKDKKIRKKVRKFAVQLVDTGKCCPWLVEELQKNKLI